MDIELLKKENRDLVETAKAEKRELTVEEMKKFNDNLEVIKFEENRSAAEAAAVEKRKLTDAAAATEKRALAAAAESAEKRKNENAMDAETREIYNAIVERRALAIGANGDSAFSSRVFELAGNRTDILSLLTIERNAVANTKFALFSPNLDNVTRVSEDGTGSAVATSAFAPVTVTPVPYLAYVPLTDSFIKQNPAGVVSRLTGLFNKSFLRKMASEVVIGNGTTAMKGVFIDAGITTSANCALAGAPKLVDMTTLIAKMTGKFLRSELAIVIHPTLWGGIMALDTARIHINNNSDFFTFDGVKIIESDDAPTTLTAASKVAVIGNFADYGIAVAEELGVEVIGKVAGSLNSNIQGTAYFDGKAIVPSSFATLKTV